MRIEKLIPVMLISLCLSVGPYMRAHADTSGDLILKLLVKKGVITQKEANELKDEITKVEAEQPAAAEAVQIPGWVEKIKLKGDVRYRNEVGHPGAGPNTYRQRVRARVGIEGEVTDTVKAGIGIATGANGDGTGRSTNQTLQGEFGSYDLNLDYAYIKWSPKVDPLEKVMFEVGKFKKPIYTPGDFLWDSDLRFDGAAGNIKYSLGEELGVPLDLYVNGGFFIVDYLAASYEKSPYLGVIQGGVGSSIEDIMDWKSFVTYYDFLNIQNTKAPGMGPGSGVANTEGSYAHDYNVLEISGEATFHFLEQQDFGTFSKPFTFFADYVWNTTGGTQNVDGWGKDSAWQVGTKLGKAKFNKFGDWMAVYSFRSLSRNAFPTQFPDADFARGLTDAYGHEAIFSFGLARNWWLEFDYYVFRDKTQGTNPNNKWGQRAQADINVKF